MIDEIKLTKDLIKINSTNPGKFEKDVFITADQNYRIYVGLRWSHTDSNRLFAYIQDEINREIEMAADVDQLAQSAVEDVLDMSAPITNIEVN